MNAKYIKYAIALFTTVTAIFIGTPVNTYAKEETINYMGEGKQVQTDESHSKKSEHDLMHVHDGLPSVFQYYGEQIYPLLFNGKIRICSRVVPIGLISGLF